MNQTNSALLLATARRDALPLNNFPGELPASLSAAYDLQEAAIEIADERIAGWKVAMVKPEFRSLVGAERLAGPIFKSSVHEAQDGLPVDAAVYEHGFSAVEAEFAIRLAEDLPRSAAGFAPETIAAAVGSIHVSAEIVSSPIPAILELGPLALISDLGGNAGCVVGPEVSGWQTRALTEMRTRTSVNGSFAGEGSAANIPGGPLAALSFLANQLATRRRTLRRGDIVLTGMTTGIHEIGTGDSAAIEFSGIATLNIVFTARSSRQSRR